MSEEVIVDFSNIPLKPTGKKEILRLEIALIIGTVLRREILELLKDPVEKSNWMDSLAVAASAFARHLANIPIEKIAEELGRSELTIKSHLGKRTKVGRLIADTFDKIARGELRISIPYTRPQQVPLVEGEVDQLKREIEELRGVIRTLEDELRTTREKLSEKERELDSLVNVYERVVREKEEISAKYHSLLERIREVTTSITSLLEELSRLGSG